MKNKKCPICNSTRTKETEKGLKCLKCDYVHKMEVKNENNN